jgi:tRNA A37 threonylcarbamoyladenosine synthetase subunit TsaC/SUA5/YrdC
MQIKQPEIVSLRRLKKDGGLSDDIIETIVFHLRENKTILLPVDNIYTVVALSPSHLEKAVPFNTAFSNGYIKLISSFKMLNQLADYTKFDYDFLNRIWPGEVVVLLREKEQEPKGKITIRYPKSKFMLDIIEQVDQPLVCAIPFIRPEKIVYRKKEIMSAYSDFVDLVVVIDELCKRHPLPTVIDISNCGLKVLVEGKVSSEEIKSLFFLGKADEVL